MTFAQQVISFYSSIEFSGILPPGISIMNPFKEDPRIIPLISSFYTKFYNDNKPRHLILGINPGRFGAGVTGIPFTDSKRLSENCGLPAVGLQTHETSSVFIYEMIEAFGGVQKFYSCFYVSSVVPLGFISASEGGKEFNYNYYDSKKLTESLTDFIICSLREQLKFGIETDICFCLGTGKNYRFLSELNSKMKFFDRIVPLEHPRFVMQYKSKQIEFYISKYIAELGSL